MRVLNQTADGPPMGPLQMDENCAVIYMQCHCNITVVLASWSAPSPAQRSRWCHSAADVCMHPCSSLKEGMSQAWFCELCFQNLKSADTGQVLCWTCKVRLSLCVPVLHILKRHTWNMMLSLTAGCCPEKATICNACRVGEGLQTASA